MRIRAPMYSWCSYCQKFIGEIAPFDEHSFSHGLCKNCEKNGAMFDDKQIDKALELKALFVQLHHAVREREYAFIKAQYSKLRSMSVSNGDIFSGIYQPLLYEVGRLWETRTLSVAEEHEVTTTIEELVSLAFSEIPNIERIRNSAEPAVLITSLQQNRHILGMRLIEHWLCENQIRNQTIVPGLPDSEIVRLTNLLKPKVLALSISLPHPKINLVLKNLTEQTHGAKILIGGRFVREFDLKDLPPGVEVCTNIGDLNRVLVEVKVKLA